MTEFTASQSREFFGQGHHRFVRETRQHGVLQGVELLLQSGVDARVGVTKEIDPPGADGIQITISVMVVQPRPAAVVNSHQWHGFVVLHLGTRVPDTVQAALHQLRRLGIQIKPLKKSSCLLVK